MAVIVNGEETTTLSLLSLTSYRQMHPNPYAGSDDNCDRKNNNEPVGLLFRQAFFTVDACSVSHSCTLRMLLCRI